MPLYSLVPSFRPLLAPVPRLRLRTDTHTHTHTQTHTQDNYRNPPAHVRRGLITRYTVYIFLSLPPSLLPSLTLLLLPYLLSPPLPSLPTPFLPSLLPSSLFLSPLPPQIMREKMLLFTPSTPSPHSLPPSYRVAAKES